MIQKNSIITKAEYSKISDVTSYIESADGTAVIQGSFNEISMIKSANSTATHSQRTESAGEVHLVTGNLKLKTDFEIQEPVILKLSFENGDVLLIGSLSAEVFFTRTNNRDQKNLGFEFVNDQKPFKTA